MDEKYNIVDCYVTEQDVEVKNTRMSIFLDQEYPVSGMVIDNEEYGFSISTELNDAPQGRSPVSVDFSMCGDVVDSLMDLFVEKEYIFTVLRIFLADGNNLHPVKNKKSAGFQIHVIARAEKQGRVIVAAPFFNHYGTLALLVAEEDELYHRSIDVWLSSVTFSGTSGKLICHTKSKVITLNPDNKVTGVKLISQKDGKEYMFNAVSYLNEMTLEIVSEIDFDNIPDLYESHWNVRVMVNLWGRDYPVRIVNPGRKKKIYNNVIKEAREHPYKRGQGRTAAYFDLNKYGNLRVYTGAMNNFQEYGEEYGSTLWELANNREVSFSSDIAAKLIKAGMGEMYFQLVEDSFDNVEEIALMVYDNPYVNIDIFPVQVTDAEKGLFMVETSVLSQLCDGIGAKRFKLGLAMRRESSFIKCRLYDRDIYTDARISKYGVKEEPEENQETIAVSQGGQESSDDEDEQKDQTIYMDTICQTEYDGTKMDICPYVNKTGVFRLLLCSHKNMTVYKVVTEAIEVDVSGHWLKLQVKCPPEKRNWKGFVLSYHYKKEKDQDERYFPADEVKRTRDGYIVRAKIDISSQKFKGIYWSIRVVFEENGEINYCAVKTRQNGFKEQYKKLFQNNCKYYMVGNEKYILFPYVAGNGNVNLMYRKSEGNDGFYFRFKERVGLRLYQLFGRFLRHKKIMLIYEKYCYMAEDNGYQFFRYCMENNIEEYMHRKIYYVIDKKSSDYQKVKQYKGHVLDFMSIKFITYLLASKLLVSSDVRTHAYAWRHRSSIIAHVLQKKKHVFLQHGVTALKKVDGIFGKANHLPTNLFVVTSDAEYEIVNKYFGYNRDEIALTGFARWDVLEDKSQGRREILVMPTWRNWLDDADSKTFMESSYYKNYMRLLNSGRLSKILNENDVKMNFYIHPKFKDYIKNFAIDASRIRLVPFGSEPLNELMMQCNMLITDYSSVSWDVYYMKKPVLFYQFDIDTYMETHGSYLDMEHDLFGDRTLELDGLINLIEGYIKSGFRLKKKYADQYAESFKYTDRDNCKRICDVIKAKGY